tara:strand:+ start:633 stop:1094 length:462 start_codon:yes stop_codon:yes gene_type:complete
MSHSKTYVGSSSGWGYKRVDFINTAGTQLAPGDAGKIFVLDADMAASAQAFVYLPLLADVDLGYTVKFIVDATTSNDLTVAHHSSDSACILGVIASGDGSGGETSDDTEKAEVNFLSACCHGDSFSATKVGNGTTSWWQVDGFATANDHMSFA